LTDDGVLRMRGENIVKWRCLVLSLAATAACASVAAGADVSPHRQTLALDGLKPGAVPEAEAAARAFSTALKNGDREAVLASLSAQASISEGGHTQTRSEYAAVHLAADIAFLRNAQITPVSLGSSTDGDAAMVGSENEIHATSSKGKPVALRSRELLRLKREGAAWKIVDVQWESTPLAPAVK